MRVLVVDDEQLAREWLARLISRMHGIEVCGEACDAKEALARVRALQPDAVMLDIQIPGGSGLDVARALTGTPIVFTTAHGRYALEAFELDACDYLVKPIRYEQLVRALERARRRRSLERMIHSDEGESGGLSDGETLVVREKGVVQRIKARRVTRFRAADKYTIFRIDDVEHVVRDALDTLEERLAPLGFLRVHRSELVRRDAIVTLVAEGSRAAIELVDGQHVAVSRRYLPMVKRAFSVP